MKYDKIILISLDTLRSDGIEFNKDPLYTREYNAQIDLRTSRLDELAAKGCFFSNAISVAPYTSASHAAYFSGLWPKNNGLHDQFNEKLKAENVFEKFSKLGYRTMFKSDFPFILGKYLNMVKGVDEYVIEDEDVLLEKLNEQEKTLAFFHFGQIHYPYGFHNLTFGGDDYRKKVIELEHKYGLATEKVDLEDMAVESFRDEEDLDYLYRYKKIISHLYKSKLDDDLFNLYLEGINYFHENKFNTFLDRLLERVKDENYLIVIFADHGEAWNEETYGHHNSLDEGVVRVPILFYAKDIKDQYCKNRIRTIDLLPTLLEMNGETIDNLDGESLTDMIYHQKNHIDRDAFCAVWVNEIKDVMKNMSDIKSRDIVDTQKNISVKYSAAYYQGDYKYTENYKMFTERSEKIVDFPRQKLFKIADLQNMDEVDDKEVATLLQDRLNALNDVHASLEGVHTSDNLKKFFNIQGYNV